MSSRTSHQGVLPQDWRDKPRRDKGIFYVALAMLAVILVVMATSLPDRRLNGVWPALLTLGLSGTLLAYFLAVKPWRRGSDKVSTRDLGSESATTISYALEVRAAVYLSMLAIGLAFLIAPVLPELYPPGRTRSVPWFPAIAPYLPILALYPAAILASPLFRRRKVLALGMSASGIYHWTWFGCRFTAWNWVVGIDAYPHQSARIRLHTNEPEARSQNPEENWISRMVRPTKQQVVTAYLDAHPTIAYYALHYYLRHPEKRDELGTDAALERMRTLDFPDIIAEIKRYGDVRPR